MPRIDIQTPEQIVFHRHTAGLVTRAMAYLADEAIIIVLIIIVAAFAAWAGTMGGAVILLTVAILNFGYFLFFEYWWSGRTPGKRWMAIRVISAYGGKLTFYEVFIRNLLRQLDFLPMFMLLGGVTACISKRRQRFGDMAAGTIVVRDSRLALPAMVLRQRRANSFQDDPTLRARVANAITRDERDLLLDLTLRRDQFDPTVREELFKDAARHFRGKFPLPDNAEFLSDEQTVVNLALLVQDGRFTD